VKTAEDLVDLVVSVLDDGKAEDIAIIDLRGKSSMADHMVIATGGSNRHVGALADHAADKLKQAGQPIAIEGMPQCDWVLIDAGDIIVHLFRPEVRAFYNLEKMWGTGLRPELPGRPAGHPAQVAAAPA
jgi:ribosome-associated protein